MDFKSFPFQMMKSLHTFGAEDPAIWIFTVLLTRRIDTVSDMVLSLLAFYTPGHGVGHHPDAILRAILSQLLQLTTENAYVSRKNQLWLP